MGLIFGTICAVTVTIWAMYLLYRNAYVSGYEKGYMCAVSVSEFLHRRGNKDKQWN